jgi:hypothetical protein
MPGLRPLKVRRQPWHQIECSDNKKVCTALKDCPKEARFQNIRVQDLARAASLTPVKRRRQNGLLVYLFISSYGMEPVG